MPFSTSVRCESVKNVNTIYDFFVIHSTHQCTFLTDTASVTHSATNICKAISSVLAALYWFSEKRGSCRGVPVRATADGIKILKLHNS